jgi:muconate cycloisomerase
MMKITAVEAIPFRLPVRREFKWAGLRAALGGFVLVRVRTSEGLIGYGEATPLPDWGGDFHRHGGETQQTVVSIIESVLGPALLGADPLKVKAAHLAMQHALRGHSYAKCAIDIALHDIAGKALDVPIHQLLGGAVRASVPVAHMVGLMGDSEATDEALAAIADGAGALQIKGGESPNRDLALITSLRKALPSHIKLRLDANQGYCQPKTAINIICALDDIGLDFIEQPVMGLADMAEVKRNVPIPVIADESCWDGADAIDIVNARAADCLSIYLAKAGGFTGARTVAAIAEVAGLPCDVNGSIESGIGNAANIHLALAMPSITLAAVIPVSAPRGRHTHRVAGNYFEDDIIVEPFAVKNGALLPLQGPGLGIEVDEDKLARYRVE